MINAVKELLRGAIQIILLVMVLKVFFNFLRFGSPFSKRRMMYNMAKMNFHNQQSQGKQKTPNGYFEYKVWRANRRNEMLKKCFSLLGTGIKTTITSINKHRNKKVVTAKDLIQYNYKPVDISVFENNDPDCMQYMG